MRDQLLCKSINPASMSVPNGTHISWHQDYFYTYLSQNILYFTNIKDNIPVFALGLALRNTSRISWFLFLTHPDCDALFIWANVKDRGY